MAVVGHLQKLALGRPGSAVPWAADVRQVHELRILSTEFRQAYVIAHEVGHHVQNLLGISSQVTQAQRAAGKRESNRLSVMLELQADCLAGVWAHHAHDERNILEQGDIEEGLNAAAQIGDDRMQRRSGGFVMPDSFTHGSSEQRARWFRTGLASGDVQSCNTFDAASL
jgi:predicted metalloprotease